jgi:hypothetical protein
LYCEKMVQLPKVLLSVAVTFLSWGAYGVLLHNGKNAMGESSLRPFVAVGVAYFFIAVVGSLVLLIRKPEKGKWTFAGAALSIFAGSIGALGALGVILALKYKGSPMYVMPLVFGGAPVVNTLVTSWLGKTFKQISPMFIAGLVLVALGAVGVLVTKPAAPKHASAATSHGVDDSKSTADESKSAEATTGKEVVEEDASTKGEGKSNVENTTKSSEAASTVKGTNETSKEPITEKSVVQADPLKITLSIIMAIICWGGYGPFLHLGQMKMAGSRLRPFLCVGIAYFFIAVAVPLLLLNYLPDPEPGNWGTGGFMWSLAAGAAGAIGALGIIFAFNFGGKPIYVMPLIFGFAPVVNTFLTMALSNAFGQVSVYFLISLAVVIGGAVTVLIFAPRGQPHAPPPKTEGPSKESDSYPYDRKLPWGNRDSQEPGPIGESTGSNPLVPPNS